MQPSTERRSKSAAAVRREGGVITRIESPLVNSGQTEVAGLDLQARVDWKADWADMAFDARWLHTTRHESRVAGEMQPGDYPRNRVHASLGASRGDFTASWSAYSVSGFWNVRETGRYEAWIGHDIAFRWREAFGLSGMDLAGGILNVADRGPSLDPTVPGVDGADETLDSVRGRTLFLSAKVAFDP